MVEGLAGFEPGWFENGTMTWSSGARAGTVDRIDRHVVAGALVRLFPRSPDTGDLSPGDAFIARAGCDKRFSTCSAKFSNALRFRGFPHLPGNDAAYAYAADGGTYDGGPLIPRDA